MHKQLNFRWVQALLGPSVIGTGDLLGMSVGGGLYNNKKYYKIGVEGWFNTASKEGDWGNHKIHYSSQSDLIVQLKYPIVKKFQLWQVVDLCSMFLGNLGIKMDLV